VKVVITGHRGFLGRNFHRALHEHDLTLIDIRDGIDARDYFRGASNHVDLVIHCAAVEPHRAAIDYSPILVGSGCVELDAALYGWASRTKPGHLVFFSSSAAYPVDRQTGSPPNRLNEADINIDAPEQADAMYGALKLMGERLAHAYRQQGGAVTVVRPFSGYGEDQDERFPFGAFVGRARRHEDPFTVWGDGSQVRDWIHIDDIVQATLTAVEEDVPGPVNLCTGRDTSFNELARLVCEQAGYKPTLRHILDAPQGVAYRVGDPAKLHTFYTPKVELEEGIRRALKAA
jgi:nucleoside-diphosphate-sugar epimerase